MWSTSSECLLLICWYPAVSIVATLQVVRLQPQLGLWMVVMFIPRPQQAVQLGHHSISHIPSSDMCLPFMSADCTTTVV